MEHAWIARSVRPIVAGYVAAVFVVFMALAYFVFHSPDAVKALFLTAIGAVASVAPGILGRVEYRLTADGLARRPLADKKPREFKEIFRWDGLSHMVPTGSGFKYYKKMNEPKPLVRFFKSHFSARYSGELHVEQSDRARVRALIDQRGVPMLRPSRSVDASSGHPSV
ncbi:MAG: hypothetical protein LJF04_03610 [Gemmatimonadetes bacterium]|nr:hypothetical protein [Gemmatimonadota bacterium]